jgi:orotate phosphoribosyltransferase
MFAQKLKHGRQNQVEGFLQKGQNVVVEDLISTGNSSLFVALRAAGANIKGWPLYLFMDLM